MSIEELIKEAQDLLVINPEWKERYSKYARDILSNIDNEQIIKKYKRRFNEFSPLMFYISTTHAKKNLKNRLYLDVRFSGQSVATLKASLNEITISTKGKADNNKRDFDCNIELNNVSWLDKVATEFRKHFRDRKTTRNKTKDNKRNEEHNVESLLLTEFSKRSSINKAIFGIQPIKILGYRFGMPTPISASNHKTLRYSEQYGGGIDIFARTGKGRATYLTVIEVKDENNSKEPPIVALKQAIRYAVFIRELLRSDCGENWYKIFGFSGKIPNILTIRAVCAMPNDIQDESFAKQTFKIGDDKIECHYIYFKYDEKILTEFQTSL